MKRTITSTVLIFMIAVLTSCSLASNYFSYKQSSKAFVEALLAEDYDRCMSLFALEHEIARETDMENVRAALEPFRTLIVENFGDDLYLTVSSYSRQVQFSTAEMLEDNKMSTLFLQISNGKEFSVLNFLYDDVSGKIINVKPENVKEKVPNLLLFWLFGLLALCVPAFNIYIINRIRKSGLKRKWLKYLTVLFFNVPAITYLAMGSFNFELLSFQFLLGISFTYMGYLSSHWTVGLPLGGLYWWWRLRSGNQETAPATPADDPTLLDSFDEGPDPL